MVIPLRIFLDLLHMVLTHDEDKYQALYSDVYPYTEFPAAVIEGLPVSHEDVGCYHMVTYQYNDREIKYNYKDNKAPKIPQVSKEHLRLTGTSGGLRCTIIRQPKGPLFLLTRGWDMYMNGVKTVMMTSDFYNLEHVFPLCHTEQLPGLVAVVHKWLEADYQNLGLLVRCYVLSNMTLIPTPVESLGYRYTRASMDQYWPLLSNPKDMWHTAYDDGPPENENEDEDDPNGNIAERIRMPQDGEGNDNNWPKISEVSKEHLRYTGIRVL
ncbi:hypothetical protein ACER0C_025800 [Sarotherodon galilaeus]